MSNHLTDVLLASTLGTIRAAYTGELAIAIDNRATDGFLRSLRPDRSARKQAYTSIGVRGSLRRTGGITLFA